MTKEKTISKIFGLNDERWLRHSNPWSVWTRNSALPILILAFWSRAWLGFWSIVPIIVAILWIIMNPRLFSKPRSTNNWASKSVLGERVWANRDKGAIPVHHKLLPNILSAVAGIGALFVIWGTYKFAIWHVVFGAALVYCGKLWFLDRMVWLYEDMKEDPQYKTWLY